MNDSLNPAGGSINLDELLGLKRTLAPNRDSRRDKWIRWLAAIDRDLSFLMVNRMAWRTLAAVWRERMPQLPPSVLFDYFSSTYAHTQASGIRRQIDKRNDVISLWKLLDEIAENPQRLSRDWFVAQYEWGQQHLGQGAFAVLDPQNLGYVNSESAVRDLASIETVAEKTRTWVNHHIAHHAIQPTDAAPSFSEIEEALSVLSEVFIRWNCILTGADMASLEPVAQYDWIAPLRVPWIISPSLGKSSD